MFCRPETASTDCTVKAILFSAYTKPSVEENKNKLKKENKKKRETIIFAL
jgi:hypothetical protein